MNATNPISSVQPNSTDFKTYIIEKATLHPITTIFLVIFFPVGIATLAVLGLKRIYESYTSPTTEKVKTVDSPVVQQNVPPAQPEVPEVPAATKSSFTAVKATQAALLGLSLFGAYMSYNYGYSTVVSEAARGYYANWAQNIVADASVDLATQCTTAYSLSQGGYSYGQYLWAPFYLYNLPTVIKNNVTQVCTAAVNLVSPIKDAPVITPPPANENQQPAPQKAS